MNLFLTESGEIINLDNVLIVRQTEMDHYSVVLQNITFNVSIGDYKRIKNLCEHIKVSGIREILDKEYKKIKKEVKKKGKKK